MNFIRVGNRWFNVARIQELDFTSAGTKEGNRLLQTDRLRIWFGSEDSSTLYGDEASLFLSEFGMRMVAT